MKVIFFKIGKLESLLFIIFLFSILSCSQSIHMYSGPELKKSQCAIVFVPSGLKMTSINDMTFDNSPHMFYNLNLYLIPGNYHIKAYLEHTSTGGSLTTTFKSITTQGVWFYAKAGNRYDLGFDINNGKWDLWVKNVQNK
ncbi:MAG: hypothetical protein GWP19_08035 [Planctomycetia bacterium]|nr:hypothetical protein [Planctomycetia bacterium]